MSDNILDDPAMMPMVIWYGVDCYDNFNTVDRDDILEAVTVAQKFSLENPLFQRDSDGVFPTVELPHFGKRSGPYAAVLMAAWLVWEQRQEFGKDAVIPDSKLLTMADEAYSTWQMTRGN